MGENWGGSVHEIATPRLVSQSYCWHPLWATVSPSPNASSCGCSLCKPSRHLCACLLSNGHSLFHCAGLCHSQSYRRPGLQAHRSDDTWWIGTMTRSMPMSTQLQRRTEASPIGCNRHHLICPSLDQIWLLPLGTTRSPRSGSAPPGLASAQILPLEWFSLGELSLVHRSRASAHTSRPTPGIWLFPRPSCQGRCCCTCLVARSLSADLGRPFAAAPTLSRPNAGLFRLRVCGSWHCLLRNQRLSLAQGSFHRIQGLSVGVSPLRLLQQLRTVQLHQSSVQWQIAFWWRSTAGCLQRKCGQLNEISS